MNARPVGCHSRWFAVVAVASSRYLEIAQLVARPKQPVEQIWRPTAVRTFFEGEEEQYSWPGSIFSSFIVWSQTIQFIRFRSGLLSSFIDTEISFADRGTDLLVILAEEPADPSIDEMQLCAGGASDPLIFVFLHVIVFIRPMLDVHIVVGLFFRAGWADGNIEPWDFTDIDRTSRSWGRPDDTIGIAGVVNGIDKAHIAFLNAGGLGILVGDGQLTNYGLEQIFEAYCSYALNSSTKLTFDYQFVANPGTTTPTAARPTSSLVVRTGSSRRNLHEATFNRQARVRYRIGART
jgi:Carbohydrate-selective porin, OprB family